MSEPCSATPDWISSPPPDSSGQQGAGESLLELRGIGCSFGTTTVLHDVQLTVGRGEYVALLGANGAGKSTLLRICAGLLRPSAGTVSIAGTSFTDRRCCQRRIGMVFQKHQLVPQSSVLTNVIHGRLGFPEGWRCCWQITAPESVRRRAMECLAEVGLAHKASQRARSLSGGESQRVAIARALIRDPELMLADEPTASLDPAAGEEVWQLLQTLNRQRGMSIVLATHDVPRALQAADRVVGIRRGCVVIDASPCGPASAQLSELYRASSPLTAEGPS